MQSLIPPFDAYQGDKPYVFVSYAHKDSDIVYEHISKLHDAGFRIWYDEGIDPGADWSDEIASALQGCAAFLVFVSEASLASHNVRKEIIFAIDQRKHMLCVHIEEVELPIGLKMQLGNIQALLETRFHDKDKFYGRLHEGLLPDQTLRVVGEAHTKASKQHIPATPSTSHTPAQSNSSTKIIAALVAIIVIISAGAGYMWLQQSKSPTRAVESVELAKKDATLQTSEDAKNEASAQSTKRVEKEVEVDPRKELASMGLSWTEYAYLDQVKMADMNTVKLFYDGGFDPYTKRSFSDVQDYVGNMTSFDQYSAFTTLIPMPAVTFEIWKSERARAVMKLACEYGYSPKKDTAFLQNFVERLDSMLFLRILDENQVKETLLFLKSLDKSILDTLKLAHEDMVKSMQNNAYKGYVDTLQINTLKQSLISQKTMVDGLKDMVQEKADNNTFAKILQKRVNTEQAKIKKIEEDIARAIKNQRDTKLEFHQKYIKILDELMV